MKGKTNCEAYEDWPIRDKYLRIAGSLCTGGKGLRHSNGECSARTQLVHLITPRRMGLNELGTLSYLQIYRYLELQRHSKLRIKGNIYFHKVSSDWLLG